MIKNIEFHIDELDSMKKYPTDLNYIGNLDLLKKKKVSIVGTRRPSSYTKATTAELASKLSKIGICVVSGGAMGVDAIAHKNSGSHNTIMVAGTSLDIRYPSVNKSLIKDIERDGLVLSMFKPNTPSAPWTFPMRNELVVALGDILIVSEADLNSGTIRSVEFALKMKKEIYVLSHRINESLGTNKLLKGSKAKVIYDIDDFISGFEKEVKIVKETSNKKDDDFIIFCKKNPSYDELIQQYSQKAFEAELLGEIEIIDSIVYLK